MSESLVSFSVSKQLLLNKYTCNLYPVGIVVFYCVLLEPIILPSPSPNLPSNLCVLLPLTVSSTHPLILWVLLPTPLIVSSALYLILCVLLPLTVSSSSPLLLYPSQETSNDTCFKQLVTDWYPRPPPLHRS